MIYKELQLSFSWIRGRELAALCGAVLMKSVENQVQIQLLRRILAILALELIHALRSGKKSKSYLEEKTCKSFYHNCFWYALTQLVSSLSSMQWPSPSLQLHPSADQVPACCISCLRYGLHLPHQVPRPRPEEKGKLRSRWSQVQTKPSTQLQHSHGWRPAPSWPVTTITFTQTHALLPWCQHGLT